jgi:hypothetical protein
MKYIGFDNKMIEILINQIGKKIYNITYEDSSGDNISFGNLVMKIDDKLIEISNNEDMNGWDKDYESAHFSCKYVDEYIPCVNNVDIKTIDINEIIKDINIIYDEINDEYYNFNYDMAVEIITNNHKYLISRGYYYSEIINISIDKEMDDIYPISRVIEDWKDEDPNRSVTVTRQIKNIKERRNLS